VRRGCTVGHFRNAKYAPGHSFKFNLPILPLKKFWLPRSQFVAPPSMLASVVRRVGHGRRKKSPCTAPSGSNARLAYLTPIGAAPHFGDASVRSPSPEGGEHSSLSGSGGQRKEPLASMMCRNADAHRPRHGRCARFAWTMGAVVYFGASAIPWSLLGMDVGRSRQVCLVRESRSPGVVPVRRGTSPPSAGLVEKVPQGQRRCAWRICQCPTSRCIPGGSAGLVKGAVCQSLYDIAI
jgi:hypothetical protein